MAALAEQAAEKVRPRCLLSSITSELVRGEAALPSVGIGASRAQQDLFVWGTELYPNTLPWSEPPTWSNSDCTSNMAGTFESVAHLTFSKGPAAVPLHPIINSFFFSSDCLSPFGTGNHMPNTLVCQLLP